MADTGVVVDAHGAGGCRVNPIAARLAEALPMEDFNTCERGDDPTVGKAMHVCRSPHGKCFGRVHLEIPIPVSISQGFKGFHESFALSMLRAKRSEIGFDDKKLTVGGWVGVGQTNSSAPLRLNHQFCPQIGNRGAGFRSHSAFEVKHELPELGILRKTFTRIVYLD